MRLIDLCIVPAVGESSIEKMLRFEAEQWKKVVLRREDDNRACLGAEM